MLVSWTLGCARRRRKAAPLLADPVAVDRPPFPGGGIAHTPLNAAPHGSRDAVCRGTHRHATWRYRRGIEVKRSLLVQPRVENDTCWSSIHVIDISMVRSTPWCIVDAWVSYWTIGSSEMCHRGNSQEMGKAMNFLRAQNVPCVLASPKLSPL